MPEDHVLDTTFDDPPFLATEIDGLQFALSRVRAQFAWKVGGLDAEALNKRLPPAAMTLGGLILHLTHGEMRRFAALTGESLQPPWDATDTVEPDVEWSAIAGGSPEGIYRGWRDAVARTDEAWARVLADGGLDRPVPHLKRINLRRGLIDQVEEYIRHTGHADLIRESIDGLVGEDPPRPT